MYKLISVILPLVLILSLSACGGAKVPQEDSTKVNAEENGSGTAAEAEISLTGEITGEITISTYDTMMYKAFLEDAARLFEEKYPGTTVKLEAFSIMPEIKTSGQGNMIMAVIQDDPQGRQDYINRVNTALMSGGGADILAIDVLPFYKYADSGHLENLTAYIQSDSEFNKSDYRVNILDALEYKNGIWFLPTDYTFNFYAYDSALLKGSAASGFGIDGKSTAKELIGLAETSFDGSAKIFDRPDYTRGPRPDMWSLLLEENYTSFVDIENKTANFNNGSFENLLESVKKYGEEGYISKGITGQSDAEQMMQRSGEDATGRFFFKPKNVSSLISFFTRNLDMRLSAMGEGDTMAIGEDDEIAGIEANADGSVPFTYSQAYGISSNSNNKETAWAFLKFLLSEEMQLNTNLQSTALPILNSAREKKMEIMLTSMMRQQGQSLSEAQLEASAKYNEAAEKLSDQIDAYVIRDTAVNDMIAAEVQYFFEGNKTASEVASTLQNKVTLYLNE